MAAELVRATERFGRWRRTRRSKARIPQRLWELAVKLAAAHGISRTAQSLKLDYYSLKSRVEAAGDCPAANASAFIELPAGLGSVKECVIEFDDPTGVQLRVALKGYDATEVAVVGRLLRAAPSCSR